ncbi:hypothetical protein [Streptomyces sp. NPDC093225]|uniref:hypothetical protein n=1 Tax=Streptomyces sp. NPDC093225 TaxID=3366034 RepID=UPI0037FE4E0B
MLAAVTGVGLWLAPAAAADSSRSVYYCGSWLNKRCGYGGVTDNNLRVFACDTYANGEGFFTQWWLTNGESGWVADPNGSEAGCGEWWATGASRVASYQACTNTRPPICSERIWL